MTKKTTATKSTAPKAGKTASAHPGRKAYEQGVEAAATHGKVKAGEPTHCPYMALAPKTKTAFYRDCYFAGVHGDTIPKEPDWFTTAEA